MSYDLLNRKVFSNPLNWSKDVACLMLWESPFHILGAIDENEEFWTSIVLHLLIGNIPILLEHSGLPWLLITRLDKYFGAVDVIHLYMKAVTLKMIHSFTFTQWRSAITDEIWSNFLRSHITLQDMFLIIEVYLCDVWVYPEEGSYNSLFFQKLMIVWVSLLPPWPMIA